MLSQPRSFCPCYISRYEETTAVGTASGRLNYKTIPGPGADSGPTSDIGQPNLGPLSGGAGSGSSGYGSGELSGGGDQRPISVFPIGQEVGG